MSYPSHSKGSTDAGKSGFASFRETLCIPSVDANTLHTLCGASIDCVLAKSDCLMLHEGELVYSFTLAGSEKSGALLTQTKPKKH